MNDRDDDEPTKAADPHSEAGNGCRATGAVEHLRAQVTHKPQVGQGAREALGAMGVLGGHRDVMSEAMNITGATTMLTELARVRPPEILWALPPVPQRLLMDTSKTVAGRELVGSQRLAEMMLPFTQQITAGYADRLAEMMRPFMQQITAGYADRLAEMMRPATDSLIKAYALQAQNAMKPLAAMMVEQDKATRALASAWQLQAVQLSAGVSTLAKLLANHSSALSIPFLGDGMLAYAGAQNIIASVPMHATLLRGGTLRPARQLDSYVGTLGARPTERRAKVAGLAGQSIATLMVGEALLTPDLMGDDVELLGYQAEEIVLEPWQQGYARFRQDLYDALADVDPMLPEYLKGAWSDIHLDGPAAVSKAANCLTEVLDLFLRTLADPTKVMNWLAANGLAGDRYLHNNKPTRAAKVAYIVRSRSRRDRNIMTSLEKSLTSRVTELRSSVEGMKHGGHLVTVGQTLIRVHAQSVESLLAEFLFSI